MNEEAVPTTTPPSAARVCLECGTADLRGGALGVCKRCYKRAWDSLRGGRPWSREHAACVRCGSSKRRHAGHGLCIACYSADERSSAEGKLYAEMVHARYRAGETGIRTMRAYAAREETKRRKWIDNLRRREMREGVWIPIPDGYEGSVLEVFEFRCARCGADGKLELDHHQPLQDGFPLFGNSVPLCRSCNGRKHARKPERFYEPTKLAEIEQRLSELRRRLAVAC